MTATHKMEVHSADSTHMHGKVAGVMGGLATEEEGEVEATGWEEVVERGAKAGSG